MIAIILACIGVSISAYALGLARGIHHGRKEWTYDRLTASVITTVNKVEAQSVLSLNTSLHRLDEQLVAQVLRRFVRYEMEVLNADGGHVSVKLSAYLDVLKKGEIKTDEELDERKFEEARRMLYDVVYKGRYEVRPPEKAPGEGV